VISGSHRLFTTRNALTKNSTASQGLAVSGFLLSSHI